MVGTVNIFEFKLKLQGQSSTFVESVEANTKPLAEKIIKSRYPNVSILSCQNKGMIKGALR